MTSAAQGYALPEGPDFDLFYRALHHRSPFPWQHRLANEVAQSGEWPQEVGVPTGLGKTACLEIAIWWIAKQAHLPPTKRTTPTRIWWVVNRRLLVDSIWEHAQHIRDQLIRSRGGDSAETDLYKEALASVAVRLGSIAAASRGTPEPLEVIRLRGSFAQGHPKDPSQPAVLLSTVPMFGSRLLFRGYGSSDSMRPIDAALAGTDSLVFLDEAHLARHLPKLMEDLQEVAPACSQVLPEKRSCSSLVLLTATGDSSVKARFDLSEEDRMHPIVKKRLHAGKPTKIVLESDNSNIAVKLVEETERLLANSTNPASILVFANTPKTARSVFQYLGKKKLSAELLLLTGLMREAEAERVRKRIMHRKDGMSASRSLKQSRDQHLIVVATQTLEVGADISADYLVTETCGVRALTQRLGRLNRMGECSHSRAVVVHIAPKARGEKAPQWPVYGPEPSAVIERLRGFVGSDDMVDLCPGRIGGVLGSPNDDPGRAPELLYGLLWEWLKTTTPPRDEAPVEPYFSGISGPDYSVSVLWRAHVPKLGDRLWPRPRDAEAIDVPIAEIRHVLKSNTEIRRLTSDRVTIESCPVTSLRPGDLVVLSIDRGLMDEFGWNPKSKGQVRDDSLSRSGLPLDASALNSLCGVNVGNLISIALAEGEGDEDVGPEEQKAAIAAIINALREAVPAGWDKTTWENFIDSLLQEVRQSRDEVSRLPVRAQQKITHRLDEFDEMSLASSTEDLDLHGRFVQELARKIATSVGVPDELANVVERAALMHDIGKSDSRFQRWLDPCGHHTSQLLAKSDTPRHLWERDRIAAGWPRGGRHESLSARLVQEWLVNQSDGDCSLYDELLLHLVLSHHGKGRPLVLPVGDQTTSTVTAKIEGDEISVSANLSNVDWNQPARFRRLNNEFGPWGLALLEAIMRQADHVVSGGGAA